MTSYQISQDDINGFNTYFTKNINSITPTFDEFDKVLHYFNYYLLNITINHNYIYIKLILNNDISFINDIYINVLALTKYYKKLSDKVKKEDNYLLSVAYHTFIMKSVFIIYQFYYYFLLSKIITIKTNDCNIALEHIIENVMPKIQDKLDLDKPYNKSGCDIDCKFLLFFKICILNFNETFYGIVNNKYIVDLYAIENTENIKEKLNPSSGDKDLILKLKSLLLTSINELDKINKIKKLNNLNNELITLPQYTGICWLISFITAVSYSDYSKQLLLNKTINTNKLLSLEEIVTLTQDDIEKLELSHENLFYSLIHYIIENITYDFKTYSELKIQPNECKVLQVIKYIPLVFLNRFLEYIKMFIDLDLIEEDKTFLTKSKTEQEQLISARAKELNQTNKDIVKRYSYTYIEKCKKTTGLQRNEYSIIKLFYTYLEINCLYFYNIDDKFYNIKETKLISDYDVIVIDYNLKDTYNYEDLKKNVIENSSNIKFEFEDDDTINYNGFTYKLDYILYGNDEIQTCVKCGHVISGIQYNKTQYYHDSGSLQSHKLCDDDQMRITCPLIQRNWKLDYNNDFCFKFPNCLLTKEYPIYTDIQGNDKENFIKNSNSHIYYSLCFKANANLLKCYVKIPPNEITQGGKQNKKSSNTIKRKVYLDKKTNKSYIIYDNKKIYLS